MSLSQRGVMWAHPFTDFSNVCVLSVQTQRQSFSNNSDSKLKLIASLDFNQLYYPALESTPDSLTFSTLEIFNLLIHLSHSLCLSVYSHRWHWWKSTQPSDNTKSKGKWKKWCVTSVKGEVEWLLPMQNKLTFQCGVALYHMKCSHSCTSARTDRIRRRHSLLNL